jgi:hypothetical protein
MSDYEYSGPRIPRTPANEHVVRLRFRRQVDAVASLRFKDAVKAWADTDDGAFPDKERIRRQVIAELHTLCRALDGWGSVDPDTILEPEWMRQLGDSFE